MGSVLEPVYYLTDTPSELQKLLETQFDMDEYTARLSLCLLLPKQQGMNEVKDPHLALWNLSSQETFRTPVFKSRFSISLTDTQADFLKWLSGKFAETLLRNWLQPGSGDLLGCVCDLLQVLYQNVTRIEDHECCVYYQALNWKTSHPNDEFFSVEAILPECPEGVCIHLDLLTDRKWDCHCRHQEQCGANAKRYTGILDELCERKVFNKYNNLYRFTK